MIDVVQYNTRRDLVKLNPVKTEVIRMAKKDNNVSSEYTLEGQKIGHGDLILIMRILFVCPSLAFHQG
jgi:hypothetical protein